jgi:SOS response regulatory protein OraA/RecX
VPTVTGLTERSRDRVAVEVDGAPWRTLPAVAVVRAGIVPGTELDRPRARMLRRELRRSKAIARAARALARRDLTERAVDERLERAGFLAAERAEALGALGGAGAIDDERYAHGRAAALAERAWGDGAIRWQLERHGVAADLAEAAVAGLEPEAVRLRRILATRGATPATARQLARRGFAQDVVGDALAGEGGMPLGREVG